MESELFSRLYRRYYRELYLYLYALCKNPALTEDLVQETFLKALLALPDSHTNMKAWLYMVGRNLFFNSWRQAKKTADREDFSEIPENAPSPADKLIADETRRMLYHALSRLDLRKREILQMQYFDGFSQKEIAAILRITPENVRVLAYRGKKELKTYLEENGYDLSGTAESV